jgi:hypothetical protein
MAVATSEHASSHAKAITRLLTDSSDPNSLAARTRLRRWERLHETFPDMGEMSVIDLGGVVTAWRSAVVRPARLTVVNLYKQPAERGAEVLVGDACALPPELLRRQFDLIYSNSVIDQVGGHYRRLQFAETVRRLGKRHWIQTAYRYFPLDAATLFPAQQLLPLRIRAALSRRWPLGYRHADSELDSVLVNLAIEGLSRTALRAYFPESEITTERTLGLIKSLIAVRRG